MKVCSIQDCPNKGGRTSQNFCDKHYKRWRRHGDPLVTLTNMSGTAVLCSVVDCGYEAWHNLKVRPFCPAHYQRWRKTGDLGGPVQRRDGSAVWFNAKGYAVMQDPSRPRKTKLVHRHVMEQHLGRPLVKGENVHHKNGDKSDYALDNLELWSTVQPSGQRVIDKVLWAREILDRYEQEIEEGLI